MIMNVIMKWKLIKSRLNNPTAATLYFHAALALLSRFVLLI